MRVPRRNVLKFAVLSVGGSAALATAGSRTAMAADAISVDAITIENESGTVSTLEIDTSGFEIDFEWRGVESHSVDVSLSLEVQLDGNGFEEVASGTIQLDGESGGGRVGDDIPWGTPPSYPIDLLSASSINADELSVSDPASSEEHTLDFRLSFDHDDADAEVTTSTTLTVVNTGANVIDDFESGDLTGYSGETGGFDIDSSNVSDGTYALHSNTNSSKTITGATSDLDAVPTRGDVFEFKYYLQDTDRDMWFYWCLSDGGYYRIRWMAEGRSGNGSTWNLQSDGSNIDTASTDTPTGEWCRVEVAFGDPTISVTVYDSVGNEVVNLTADDTAYDTGDIRWYANGHQNSKDQWYDHCVITGSV